MNGKNQTTKNTLPNKTYSDWMEKSKALEKAKIKQIEHHQNSSTTHAKGTSLGRKQKRKKRHTKNKHLKLRKW